MPSTTIPITALRHLSRAITSEKHRSCPHNREIALRQRTHRHVTDRSADRLPQIVFTRRTPTIRLLRVTTT